MELWNLFVGMSHGLALLVAWTMMRDEEHYGATGYVVFALAALALSYRVAVG